MEEKLEKIAELTLQTSAFNSNDILVNIREEDGYSIADTTHPVVWKNIREMLRKSQLSIKESGVNPLCRAQGLLKLMRNGSVQHTPILLTPVAFRIDRVREQVHLEADEEQRIVNPYLVKLLHQEYELSTGLSTEPETLAEQLAAAGFSDIDPDFSTLGNFHHHRYEVLRELDELALLETHSHALNLLLGNTPSTPLKKLDLGPALLFPADSDHRAAFHTFETADIVVQGPPGTGKSQLLTNFIGKSLHSGVSVLAVSEKRSALEVIFQKLETAGLAHLGFIATPDLSTRDFLQSLRSGWEYFERSAFQKPASVSVRKELEDNLQFVLDLLNQPGIIGGLSYGDFQALKGNRSLEGAIYQPNVPPLPPIRKHSGTFETWFRKGLHQIIGSIRHTTFQSDHLKSLAAQLPELIALSERLHQSAAVSTWEQLDGLARTALVCQLFENELRQRHPALLRPDSSEQKRFLKHSRTFQRLSEKLQQLKPGPEWKTVPSSVEVETLQSDLNHPRFFTRRKAKQRWKRLNHLSTEHAAKSLEQLEKYYYLRGKLGESTEHLNRLGIHNPAQDIAPLQQAIVLFTAEKWAVFDRLSAHERQEILTLSRDLDRFKTAIRHFFVPNEATVLSELLQSALRSMDQLLTELPVIQQLDPSCLDVLRMATDFDAFLSTILHSHYVHFCQHYPQLANFSTKLLHDKIHLLLEEQEREQFLLSQEILYQRVQQFKAYQELLIRPAAKLSAEEKILKQQLRKGKAILVKEFSKTRHFPSLRQLFASEARHWIQLLKPIWLTNPVQLAKSFPMEADLFDLCIFDEASQIPLQHALGAVQRSSRVIIAGDDQQMGPRSYFQSGTQDATSLLQQANYYLKPVTLQHHYRSRHPQLIAFSNQYFYQNRLLVFPAYPTDSQAISRHYIQDGCFENRTNTAEAQAVARLLKTALHETPHLGIVAFSQEQVDCIRMCLSEADLHLLDERTEANTAFLKPLEKVQGDECEHLIISMAYGFDSTGRFAMRFGPLNTQSGRNRLNVLFSRASQHIDFFYSVTSGDFKLSDNESINLLRAWLHFIEQDTPQVSLSFPYDLHPVIEANRLTIPSIYQQIPSAVELSTVYQLLVQRGWQLQLTD